MRVFDIRSDDGRLRAFEVDNSWLTRRAVARIIRSIPGVRVTRAKSGWFARDAFCEFELNRVRFVVEEPFGDSDQYWIGPTDGCHETELLAVRERFLSVVRPEWISARLLAALMLVSLGLSWVRRWFAAPTGTQDRIGWALLGTVLLIAGSVLTVSWALALKGGHYRSRPVEDKEFEASKRTDDAATREP
jgi:hypothetical protein